jgi:hypothetical protein
MGFATDTQNVYIGNDPILYPQVGSNTTQTQILTDSANCYINYSQMTGVLNISTGNIKITGGTNGQVLQTDGKGNLTWTAMSNGGGGGSPGGSNTQIQFNDSGSFSGSSNLEFNKLTNTLSTANIVATNITAILAANSNSQPNITSVGTLTGLTTGANANINVGGELIITNNNHHGGSNYAGMITMTNTNGNATNPNKYLRLNATGSLEVVNSLYSNTIFSLSDIGDVVANSFSGNGTNLSNITASALNTLYGATALVVDGTATFSNVSNLKILGGTNGYVLTTDGNSNLSWGLATSNGIISQSIVNSYIANYTDNVAFSVQANYANFAGNVTGSNVYGQVSNSLIAGTVYTNAQPNITSIGTLTSLTVTGNVNANVIIANGYFKGIGNQITALNGASVTGKVANAMYADTAGNANIVQWTGIANIPSTISDFGITDAYGPIVLATQSVSQPISNGSSIIKFGTTTVNSANYNASSGILQPTRSGYYQITTCIVLQNSVPTTSGTTNMEVVLYKNGTAIAAGLNAYPLYGGTKTIATTIVYLNGSTDYVQPSLVSTITNGTFATTIGANTYLQAAWIRP